MNADDSVNLPDYIVSKAHIKGFQLPNVGILKRFDKFYIELIVDGQVKHKTGATKAPWRFVDGELILVSIHQRLPYLCVTNFCGSDAILECWVYAKHKIGSDDFIGSIRETIESLLAEAAGGGWHYLAC